MPVLAIAAALLLGFRGPELAVITLAVGTPLAVAAYAMSESFGANSKLTGQVVFTSSLGSCLTLFLWIFFLKQLSLI